MLSSTLFGGSALAQMSRPSEDANLTIAALDRKIAELDIAEASFRKEMQESDEKIRLMQVKIKQHTRLFYRQTRAGAYSIGSGFDEFLLQIGHVERSRKALISKVRELQSTRERILTMGDTLERNRRERTRLSSERNQIDSIRLAFQEDARRQESYDHAFDAPTKPTYTAVYGANAPATSNSMATFSSGAFESAKGRLLLPIAGRSEVRPTKRADAHGPGLEIVATAGAPVRACYSGRVAFADRYGTFGKIVILDHGEQYFTVTGNLASIDVRVGDEISQGGKLGTVGDDGRGPSVYFELRRGGQTIAPQAWFGI